MNRIVYKDKVKWVDIIFVIVGVIFLSIYIKFDWFYCLILLIIFFFFFVATAKVTYFYEDCFYQQNIYSDRKYWYQFFDIKMVSIQNPVGSRLTISFIMSTNKRINLHYNAKKMSELLDILRDKKIQIVDKTI